MSFLWWTERRLAWCLSSCSFHSKGHRSEKMRLTHVQMTSALGIFQDLGCWLERSSSMTKSQIMWPNTLSVASKILGWCSGQQNKKWCESRCAPGWGAGRESARHLGSCPLVISLNEKFLFKSLGSWLPGPYTLSSLVVLEMKQAIAISLSTKKKGGFIRLNRKITIWHVIKEIFSWLMCCC